MHKIHSLVSGSNIYNKYECSCVQITAHNMWMSETKTLNWVQTDYPIHIKTTGQFNFFYSPFTWIDAYLEFFTLN